MCVYIGGNAGEVPGYIKDNIWHLHSLSTDRCFGKIYTFWSLHVYLSNTRLYLTLKKHLSVNDECKCQILSYIILYIYIYIYYIYHI